MRTEPTTPRRVLLIVGAECPGAHDEGVQRIAAAAAGAHVLVVAPAGRVPGERWVADLGAREAYARRRLQSWASELARHAARVDAAVGDASPALALADARADFAPEDVLAVVPGPPARWRRRERGLRERRPAIRVVARPALGLA